MPDEKRTEEERAIPDETPEVEAHGAKEAVGVGLAAAALIGGGAAAVKYAGGDEGADRPAALEARETAALDVKAADRDGDGYLTYQELVEAGGKLDVEAFRAEGLEITPEALAAAAWKVELAKIGEEGFTVDGSTIILKWKVDEELDYLARGPALEWASKHEAIDRDGDGFAAYEDLTAAGYEVKFDPLREAGYEVDARDLVEADVKLPLWTLGKAEAGYATTEDAVTLEYGVYDKFDAFVESKGDDAQ
jgi:hypothetical protein